MAARLTDDDADAAFVAELIRHQRRLYLFIGSLLPNPSDIEDVFQQTCLALWKKRQQALAADDFFAWACGFARNEALHALRSHRRSGQVCLPPDLVATLADEFVQDLATEADDRLTALADCLAKLQPPQRSLLKRCYQGAETIKAVAAELTLSPAAVTMRLQRIRHALARCIEQTLQAAARSTAPRRQQP